jgi:hypothetical protein
MLRPAYLSQRLDRALPTKDGGTLRTVADARAYMLGLSKQRELQTRWQRVAGLILEEVDIGAVSRQLELALFMDAKLRCGEDARMKIKRGAAALGRSEG